MKTQVILDEIKTRPQRAVYARCLYRRIGLPDWAVRKVVEVR